MPNFQGLLRAPRLPEWEVLLEKKHCLNENQNQRKRRLPFPGETAEAAMSLAESQYPEFKAVSARRAPL